MSFNINEKLMLLEEPKTTLNNYKKVSLYVPIGITCTFKCKNCCNIHYKENNRFYIITFKKLLDMYKKNKLVDALVLSGLEPFDNFEVMFQLIKYFRKENTKDDIIIYTGYELTEIHNLVDKLKGYNIWLKLGRYMPNSKAKTDVNLKVLLASENQYSLHVK